MQIALSLLVLLSLIAAQGPTGDSASTEYRPEGTVREYFLGAWKLVSTEVRHPDGHSSSYPDLGSDALGF